MGIDVANLERGRSGVGQRPAHRLDGPVARGMGVRNPVAAERIAVAGNFGVDAGATPARRLPFLEHHKPRALAQHKAVAAAVKRTAGAIWDLIVEGQSAQHTKAREAHRIYHRVETAGENEVRGAAPNQSHRQAERLAAGSARGVN